MSILTFAKPNGTVFFLAGPLSAFAPLCSSCFDIGDGIQHLIDRRHQPIPRDAPCCGQNGKSESFNSMLLWEQGLPINELKEHNLHDCNMQMISRSLN